MMEIIDDTSCNICRQNASELGVGACIEVEGECLRLSAKNGDVAACHYVFPAVMRRQKRTV